MFHICRRNLSDNHRRWCPYPQGKRRLYYHPRFSLPCALCRVRCGLAVASDLAVDQRAPEGKQGHEPTHGGKAPKWGIANRLSPRSAPALLRPASNQALLSVGPALSWPVCDQAGRLQVSADLREAGRPQPVPAPSPPCCPCKAHQRHQRRSVHNDHQRPPAGRVATLRAPRRTVMPNRIANDINTNDWSFDRLDRLARALHPLVFPLTATTNTSTATPKPLNPLRRNGSRRSCLYLAGQFGSLV
jgi:hypothetical protein